MRKCKRMRTLEDKKGKGIITILKLIGLFLLLIIFSGVVSAEFEGWKYYREINIKENSGKTLTDCERLKEL